MMPIQQDLYLKHQLEIDFRIGERRSSKIKSCSLSFLHCRVVSSGQNELKLPIQMNLFVRANTNNFGGFFTAIVFPLVNEGFLQQRLCSLNPMVVCSLTTAKTGN
jgi:hypothetical protein